LAVKKEQLAKAAQAKMDPRNPRAIGAEVNQPYGNFLLARCIHDQNGDGKNRPRE
jgi:hypothetical protein